MSSNIPEQAKKMTLYAIRVSGWARYQYLLDKEKSILTTHATPEEIQEFKMLDNWWRSLGPDHQGNIMRLAKEMAADVHNTESLWLASTRGVHTPKSNTGDL